MTRSKSKPLAGCFAPLAIPDQAALRGCIGLETAIQEFEPVSDLASLGQQMLGEWLENRIKEGGEGPWLVLDDSRGVVLGRTLRWKQTASTATLSGTVAMMEVLLLAQIYRMATKAGTPGSFEQALIEFQMRFGPLVALPPGEPSLFLASLRPKLSAYELLARLMAYVAELKNRSPRLVQAETVVRGQVDALHPAAVSAEERAILTDLVASGDLAPVDRLLLSLQKPPESGSREQGVDRLITTVLIPLANSMLSDGLEINFGLGEAGQFIAAAIPKDAYTLAVLSFLSRLEPATMRLCACGCGQLAPPNRAYLDANHQRRANVKQGVLARYRTRKNRGEISSEDYTVIKRRVNNLWRQGVRDEATLHQTIAKMLDERVS